MIDLIKRYGEPLDKNNIYLFIAQNFPDGIDMHSLVELRNQTGIDIPSEYASIYHKSIPPLSSYINTIKDVARNHSMFLIGSTYVAFSKFVTINRDELIRADHTFFGEYMYGLITPKWLVEIINRHKVISTHDTYFLHIVTRKGKKRVVRSRDLAILNSSMTARTGYNPLQYGKLIGFWGREYGEYYYSYIDKYKSRARIDLINHMLCMLYDYDGNKKPVIVIDTYDNDGNMIVFDGEIFEVVSYHLIYSMDRWINTPLKEYVDDQYIVKGESLDDLCERWRKNGNRRKGDNSSL